MTTNATSIHSDHYQGNNSTPKILNITGLAVLSLTAFLGNFLIVISFYKNKRIQTVTNFYLVSLAFTDMTIGFFPIAMYLTEIALSMWPFGKIFCDFTLLSESWLSQVSIFHVILISVDRYLSIRQPLNYRVTQTKSRAIYYLLGTWIVALSLWAPSILYSRYFKVKNGIPGNQCYETLKDSSSNLPVNDINFYFIIMSVAFGYFVPMTLATFINVKMFFLIKQQLRIIPKFSKTSHEALSNGTRVIEKESFKEETSNESERTEQKKDEASSQFYLQKTHLSKHFKAFRMIAIIIFTFIITLFPYYLQVFLVTFCLNCYNEVSFDICSTLTYSYSAVNPFLYAFGSHSFRKQCKAMFSFLFTKGSCRNKNKLRRCAKHIN